MLNLFLCKFIANLPKSKKKLHYFQQTFWQCSIGKWGRLCQPNRLSECTLWRLFWLVQIIPERMDTVRALYNDQLRTIRGAVWSTPGIGPWANSVSTLYCRPATVGQKPPYDTTWVCRWFANIQWMQPCWCCLPADDVACWMAANRLQLNHAISVLWCSSTRRQHQIPDRTVRIGSTAVQPVSTVHDLGIMLDGEVTVSAHVSAVVKASFAALRRIRSVRRSIPRHALLTLIQALVASKVDYCNSLLAGVSHTLLRWLQSVLNAAACLVFSTRKSEHITPLLRELHWLRVPELSLIHISEPTRPY